LPAALNTPLPLPGRKLAVVAEGVQCRTIGAKGLFYTWMVDVRVDTNPLPIATLPTPKDRDYSRMGNFGPHNLHENRPGSFQSEETIFATYHNAGVRVFDIKDQFEPKEIASWVPPPPKRWSILVECRRCGADLRLLRYAGRADVCQRLERRDARPAI